MPGISAETTVLQSDDTQGFKRLNTGPAEKVDVTRVSMRRAQGISSQARVNSIEAANVVLEQWLDAAASRDNFQCDVQILFQDGFQYRGSYRLTKSRRRLSLGRHVRKQLAALATTAADETGADSADGPVISPIGRTRAESARIALEYYNI